MSRIYLSPPDIRSREREMLLAALESGWAAPIGPDLDAFELEVAALADAPYGVGLSSGTAALHLALLELGVERGRTVIVPTLTFVATANAVCYVDAEPVFVDCDPSTGNISPLLLAEELAENSARGQLPAAVITVDLYGQCADYDRIIPLCEQYSIPVIEDAAEALGAKYNGRAAGSFGRVGVFSFNGNKIITTSSGGMVVTNDGSIAQRIRFLATQAREPAAHFEHREIGFNYRLSNLLAAFGRGQLATLPERIERRHAIRTRYTDALACVDGITVLQETAPGDSNAWLTVIFVDEDITGFDASDLRLHLETADIEARPTWKPMHMQPAFRGHRARTDGSAEHMFNTGLCLPSGSGMTNTEQDRVIGSLLEYADHRRPVTQGGTART